MRRSTVYSAPFWAIAIPKLTNEEKKMLLEKKLQQLERETPQKN